MPNMHSARWLAWQLACRLYAMGQPVNEGSLSSKERIGLKRLQDDKVVKTGEIRLDFVLCPYCRLEGGQVFLQEGQQVCHCPDCGQVALDEEDKRAWQLTPDWLTRKIRAALNLDGSQHAELGHGAVRLGVFERHPIIIAPKLHTLQMHHDIIERARVGRSATPWFLTPKPLKDVDTSVLGSGTQWWSLEERFVLFGGGLSFIPPGVEIEGLGNEPPGPTHGPFSADFRWVFLADAPDDPVWLSEAQAAIFKALWHFRGKPETAEVIMNKAGLESPKPIEVFKIKDKNRGDPRYERPKLAYEQLVQRRQREGLYWMDCALPASVSAQAA